MQIENSYTARDGTSPGDVTTVDFGYSVGYTRDENGLHTLDRWSTRRKISELASGTVSR